MKRPAQSNPHAPVPCRAVIVVQSRNKGLPVCRALNPALDGILPNEEALMGVGVFGMNESGRAFARMGIYNFAPAGPTFKFAINFDTEDGSPIFQTPHGTTRTLSEAEMALLNWVQGSLFDGQAPDGDYYVKLDRPNAADDPDADEARDLERVKCRLPLRSVFAAERRVESAIELFHEYLERDELAPERVAPAPPRRIPLISPDQVPPSLVYKGQPIIPILQVGLAPKAFLSFSVNRFSSALRSQAGRYREVKAGYIQAFSVIDALLKKGGGSMLALTVDRSIASLQTSALAHIESLATPVNLPEVQTALSMALEALRNYAASRTSTGAILMYAPGAVAQMVPEMQAKVVDMFRVPMFTAVQSIPIQIHSGFWSSGEFPFRGEELFRPR